LSDDLKKFYFDAEIAQLKGYFKNEIESLKKNIKAEFKGEIEGLKGAINDLKKQKTNFSYTDLLNDTVNSSQVNSPQESFNILESTCFYQNNDNDSATKTLKNFNSPVYEPLITKHPITITNQPSASVSNIEPSASNTELSASNIELPANQNSLPGGKADIHDTVSDAYWKCGGCPAQFGFLIIKTMFSPEVLRTSNISGKRGLKKLDENIVTLMNSNMRNLFKLKEEDLKLIFEKINLKLKNYRRFVKK